MFSWFDNNNCRLIVDMIKMTTVCDPVDSIVSKFIEIRQEVYRYTYNLRFNLLVQVLCFILAILKIYIDSNKCVFAYSGFKFVW